MYLFILVVERKSKQANRQLIEWYIKVIDDMKKQKKEST